MIVKEPCLRAAAVLRRHMTAPRCLSAAAAVLLILLILPVSSDGTRPPDDVPLSEAFGAVILHAPPEHSPPFRLTLLP